MAQCCFLHLRLIDECFQKVLTSSKRIPFGEFRWLSIPFQLNQFFMSKPKALLLIIIIILSFAGLSSSGYWEKAKANRAASRPKELPLASGLTEKMHLKAAEART